jgi:hypothetical protein
VQSILFFIVLFSKDFAKTNVDRSIPLQALAFRGEEVEPLRRHRLRGLDLSSKSRRSQVPSAPIHSEFSIWL